MVFVQVERAVKFFPREDGSYMLVLNGVSFETKEQGITCLLGPSGCGKSTLLNVIAGLERVDQGRVEIVSNHGESPNRPPQLGYVF
ncbi:MAG: ATP-binding cassette domain-containing protein, partial [Candidatus Binatota bacterium]